MIRVSVSRDDFRSIEIGKTRYFTLPDNKAVESARVTCAQLKKLEGLEFERVPTDEELTIAYKRIK